jgi:hypothetical protein
MLCRLPPFLARPATGWLEESKYQYVFLLALIDIGDGVILVSRT